MTRSMTGFARSHQTDSQGTLIWELRTVNHRYLDISMRLPEEFRAMEGRYREIISKKLQRGKLEASLRYKTEGAANTEIKINMDVVKALIKASEEINHLLYQRSEMSTLEFMHWPGVVVENETDMKPLFESSEKFLDTTLDELIANRNSEGERMKKIILQRCDAIEKIVADVKQCLPDILKAQREKILARVEELQANPDMERFEQELAYLAQKMDVDEELDRLGSHLTEIRNVLERDEAIGRRLDFLMQEFNREANTLGSKSIDIKTTQASVELKVLIEQMREQIQNIE